MTIIIAGSSKELTGQKLDDPLELFLESDIKDPICLVDDQALQVLVQEVLRVLEVIQQTTGCGDQDVDAWIRIKKKLITTS